MKRIILFAFLFATTSLSLLAQNRDWTIVASYDIYGKASGLAWDGSTFIYYGIYGANGDKVYKFNTASGSTTLQFSNPAIDDSYGMTWDGQYLWIIDQPSSSSQAALATQLDLSGNIISTITLPDHYMSGIAYDNGDFWVCTYYPDPGTIYKINSSGTILTQFQSPGEQPWDICVENGDLWVADYYDHMLYKIDMSGNLIEGHPAENIKPSGIVYDDNYLWYCDGELSSPSKLYKIDLGGAGTPAISIPVDDHDYGIVTIGTAPIRNMTVMNTGTAPLIITDIDIPAGEPVSTTFSMPATIAPGNNTVIPLKYTPTQPIPLDVEISVVSNDPVHPQEAVQLTGHGVYNGPSAQAEATAHYYGSVRQKAHTRWFFMLKNVGDDPLVIDEITSGDEAFYIFQDEIFPITIQTLETVGIGMWFNPELPVTYSSAMDVHTNDPDHEIITVSLEGEGQKKDWLMGETLWSYIIQGDYDNSPKAIDHLSDVTYDGVPDVIVCSEDNNIRCFNGNASGQGDIMWTYHVYAGSVFGQSALEIADLDDDGADEVIVGTTGGDCSIIVFEGKTGEVIWKHETNEYGGGGWVYQVDSRFDFNGDGILDVLASAGDDGNGTGPNRVYCLDGLSGESIWECYLGGPGFACIGVSDFNGDGHPDAIGGASDAGESEGRVFGIDGTNGGVLWMYTTGGTSVWALEQVEDVNGDGYRDIVAGDFSGNIYLIDPHGWGIIESVSVGYSIILRFALLDDVNGDGHPEILVAHSGTNGILLSGYDLSTVWFTALADKAWVVDRIGDVSGDAVNDAVIGTLFTDNYCYFMDGTDGSELLSIPYYTPLDAIRAIPDIVGDFSEEMVAGGRNGRVFCYSGGVNTATAIGEEPFIGQAASAWCYPNPGTSGLPLVICYSGGETGQTMIEIFDINGRNVRNLYNVNQGKGTQSVQWDTRDASGHPVPAGIYLCRIVNGNTATSLKISIR